MKNFIRLLPFYIILSSANIITAFIWDTFIEGKNRLKLFYYWDQMPLYGFNLWGHDQPATRTLSRDLAPGVSLVTIDLVWLSMLISMYGITLFIYWLIILKKKNNQLQIPLFIVGFLILLGLFFGFNERGIIY